MFLQNFGIYLHFHTALQPRRPTSTVAVEFEHSWVFAVEFQHSWMFAVILK
jgi:hypothetical protein